ncbi:MAG: hypothetical protein CR975_04975 [Gammaproteobacteria bacterium]|nr:MAG: hypothetical protein CR975_04975 [Gammaproteobacteria bacterium]
MIDLFLEPAKILISKGVKQFLSSEEQKNLSIAVTDALKREMRFNIAILKEIAKLDGSDENTRCALMASLKTYIFDKANRHPVPLSLLVVQPLDKTQVVWKNTEEKERFLKYIRKDQMLLALIERAYYRIHIGQTLAKCGKHNIDYSYIQFMLSLANNNVLSINDN